MRAEATEIPAVLIIHPTIIDDQRGHFFESYNLKQFSEAVGRTVIFVQDNQSFSRKNVIRGLHYQLAPFAQGKLMRVVRGAIFDVAVDLRKSSPTFGQHVSAMLSDGNKRQLWIPEGFAHGFQALSETAEVVYKTTNYWSAGHERTIVWNDPALAIAWPNSDTPILSAKDAQGRLLSQSDIYADL